MPTHLASLAEHYERFPQKLREASQEHPDATVVRNVLGNLAIMDVDGHYVGFIDVIEATVELNY